MRPCRAHKRSDPLIPASSSNVVHTPAMKARMVLVAIGLVVLALLAPVLASTIAILSAVGAGCALALAWQRDHATRRAEAGAFGDSGSVIQPRHNHSDAQAPTAGADAGSEAKSRILGTVSHELRTPLAGMLGLAGILGETDLTPEQQTFVRAIRNAGELMLGLVDDMLDFAKIDADRFDLNPRPTNLRVLAEDLVELFSSRGEAKGIDLAADVTTDVPQRVMVDGARLRQVLINLIGNAVKFTDRGGVAILVGRDTSEPERLRFEVHDTGPGIPQEATERIFEVFGQGVDPALHPGGSGLGLWISRGIVRRMGGDISVAPRPGGSVFAFTLALATADAEAGGPSIDLSGRRALIVAPEGLAPGILARQLTDCGAVARHTAQPAQAAALMGAATAAGELYDLILFDQRAATDPAKALLTLREAAGRRVPAAIMIPPGPRQDRTAMSAAGFDAYLVRPVRRNSLIRIADQILAGTGFGIDPTDEARPAKVRRHPGVGLSVLLAEDDEINALLLRSMLERLGHEVTEVADGEAALASLAARHFDAVVLDIQLPGRNGLDVARIVRSREAAGEAGHLRLVAATADLRAESRDVAIAAGFDRFLTKPVTVDALRDALAGASDPRVRT